MIDPSFDADLSCIKNIVVAPCGIAGLAYAGAINKLDDAKALTHLENVVGVSSGSYSAWIIALGYRGDTLADILKSKKFTDFATADLREIRRMLSGQTISNEGVFSGEKLRQWAQQLTARRLGHADLTFSDLQTYQAQAEKGNIEFFETCVDNALKCRYGMERAIGKKPIIYDFELPRDELAELSKPEKLRLQAERLMAITKNVQNFTTVAAQVINPEEKSDLSKRYTTKVFSVDTTPRVPIAQAIRLSASYPFHFRNGKIEEYGVKEYFTDGGLANPLPLDLLDKNGVKDPHTLVLDTRFSDKKLLPDDKRTPYWMQWVEARVRSYFTPALVDNVEARMDAIGKEKRDYAKSRSVYIDRGNIRATDFFIPDNVKDKLQKNGAAAMQEAIDLYAAAHPDKWESRNSPITLTRRWIDEAIGDLGSPRNNWAATR